MFGIRATVPAALMLSTKRSSSKEWLPKNTVFELFLSRFLNVSGAWPGFELHRGRSSMSNQSGDPDEWSDLVVNASHGDHRRAFYRTADHQWKEDSPGIQRLRTTRSGARVFIRFQFALENLDFLRGHDVTITAWADFVTHHLITVNVTDRKVARMP